MLQELRQKPKHIREKYAFWGAFGITAVIAVVWTVALTAKFGIVDSGVIAEEATDSEDSAGAFSRAFSDAKNGVANSWAAFTDAADISETETITPKIPAEPVPKNENVSSSTFEFSSSSKAKSTSNTRTILIATTSTKTASSTE